MLAANIKINSIDYEQTFQGIFPVVSKKIMAINTKKMLIRLFQQLGDASLPVLLNILRRLPEDTKDELLVRILDAYESQITVMLNEALKDKWGHGIIISEISLDRQDGLILSIGHIKLNYSELLNNNLRYDEIINRLGIFPGSIAISATMAAAALPNILEKKGLTLLRKDENKARLIYLVKTVLTKYNIKIELGDIQIVQAETTSEKHYYREKKPFILSEELENDIISALAGFLKEEVNDKRLLVE